MRLPKSNLASLKPKVEELGLTDVQDLNVTGNQAQLSPMITEQMNQILKDETMPEDQKQR
jgi:hypothetical protein